MRIRTLVPRLIGLAVPLGAVAAALVVGAIMLLSLGANPIDGYRALLDGAVGTELQRLGVDP